MGDKDMGIDRQSGKPKRLHKSKLPEMPARKQTEESSVGGEAELLYYLSENLTDGMVYQINSGLDGKERRFTYLSSAVERFHGLKKEDVLQNPMLLYDQVIEEDRSLVAEREKHAYATRTRLDVDVRVLLPSGQRRWRRFKSSPRACTDGSVVWDGIEIDITEQKQAEEALRASENRYRAIVESQAEFVVRYQPGGIITFVNDTLCRYANMRREDLLGRSYFPFMHPDDREEFIRKIEALDRSAPVMVAEARVVLPDGKVTWHRWTHQAIFDKRGEIVEYQSSGRDITDVKRAEEEVAERSALLQQIMDTASVGIGVIDKTGCFTHANKSMADMFGCTMEEFIGSQYVDYVHPFEREPAKENMQAMLASETISVELERRYCRKDGTEFWGHLVSNRFYDARGNNLGLIGAITDITEHKQTEERLLKSEIRFRAIVERAAEGIVVADAETKEFRFVNPEICRMLGYTRDELLRLSVTDIHPDEEAQAVLDAFEKQLAGSLADTQVICRKKDGALIYVSIRSTPFEIDGRKCLLGFFTDITERHLLEQERMKAEKLEATALLAGGIAHDFNNLLQGIFGYIEMAKMNIERKQHALEMLEEAERALHLSVNLTTQLLTFAKGGKPVKKSLRLKPVIENAVKFALSGSSTNYHIDIEDNLLQVEADEGQIAQAIQNIVINADQAMPFGGTVTVKAKNVQDIRTLKHIPDKDGYVEITIQDNGIGIPKQYLSSIFDPYFTTKDGGSGIGLATTYSIIKNHGGLIDVKSEVGKGSTFFIYLPGIEEKESVLAVQPVSPVVRSIKVLLMDDDELLRGVAEKMIKTVGHEAVCVPDGEAAVKEYLSAMESGNPYDVVILDLTVRGGMGGEETITKLLAIDPGVKAIVSSGYSESSIMSEYREHGFMACLRKPYRVNELRNVLHNVISQSAVSH